MMRIYPAVDINEGKVVQLAQGRFDKATVFGGEPFEAAKRWEEAGARYIHIVDLDGARTGSGVNNDAIKKIVEAVTVPVQVGGGIRNMKNAAEKLQLGVSRVILGTAAIKNPDFVKTAVETYGDEKVAVSIDAKDGLVAISGWEEVSEISSLRLCFDMRYIGVTYIVYTDIAKDGMMQGPNITATQEIVNRTGMSIIASGGVSSIDDIARLDGTGASGVIIGTALYEGKIDLREAIERFEEKLP